MSPAKKEVDMTTYSGRIAAKMRIVREKKQLDAAKVAKRMTKFGWPITMAAYRHWENGTRKQNVDAIPYIAKALGVKPHDILPEK